MLARRVIKADRLLSMAEVADLMKLPPGSPHARAEKVRRMVRRMEKRDGIGYLRRVGRKWFVSIATIEQLAPWDPGTLGQLRSDVDDLRHDLHVQTRRINDHASFIRKQRNFNKLVARVVKESTEF